MNSILDLQIRLVFGCVALLGAVGVGAMLLFATLASNVQWWALLAMVAITAVGTLEATGAAKVSRFTPLRATVAVFIGTATLLLMRF